MTVEYRIGDVFERLADIPDGTIDLVLTSPPFLALRSYLPADHPDKSKEIGSESDPATFIDTMLRLTAEWRRVLAPHGSIVVELGDTYSGSGGAGGDYGPAGLRDGQERFRQVGSREHRPERAGTSADGGIRTVPINAGRGWPLDKSICGIPWLYTLSLAYGRNLLNHEHRIEPWRVRNVVAWCRPNPPVGALGDKFRPATSYLTIACMSRTRYFDLDAVRGEHRLEADRDGSSVGWGTGAAAKADRGGDTNHGDLAVRTVNPAGAPPLDYWEISTQPYKGSHYATFPEALLEKPIKAMCPLKVCTTCGEPSRRIVETSYIGANSGPAYVPSTWPSGIADGQAAHTNKPPDEGARVVATTLGWTDCGHDTWRNGIILDPFGGSGTTGVVAQGLGRDAILIDIDSRNADLARERVGMFVTVIDG
jgi:DNA modification methylase